MSVRHVSWKAVVLAAVLCTSHAPASAFARLPAPLPAAAAGLGVSAAARAEPGARIILAQSGCDNDCGPSEPPERRGADPGPATLSTPATDRIVRIIREANDTCGPIIPRRYRIDCLRASFLRVANTLPRTGDYAPIRRSLEDAAAKLDRIVEANIDSSAPKLQPRYGNRQAAPKTPPLRAVAERTEARATREAVAVIEETSIVILRSGEDPTRRTAHYQRIAEAVDSSLVILRSA